MVSKLTALALAALIMCLMLPAAAAPAPLPLTLEDLAFSFEGQAYALASPAKELLDALKKSGVGLTESRADSCLFEGEDKEFLGEELLIGTLPKGSRGEDMLETVMVLAGDYLTPRGLGIGSSGEELLAAYGEPSLTDYDLMIYALGDAEDSPQLVFVMDLDTGLVNSYYYFYNTQG